MPPRTLVPTRYIELRVPLPLLAQVDARLYDPVLGKPGYGQRAALIVRLFQEWVDRTPLHPTLEESQKTSTLASILSSLPQ